MKRGVVPSSLCLPADTRELVKIFGVLRTTQFDPHMNITQEVSYANEVDRILP